MEPLAMVVPLTLQDKPDIGVQMGFESNPNSLFEKTRTGGEESNEEREGDEPIVRVTFALSEWEMAPMGENLAGNICETLIN